MSTTTFASQRNGVTFHDSNKDYRPYKHCLSLKLKIADPLKRSVMTWCSLRSAEETAGVLGRWWTSIPTGKYCRRILPSITYLCPPQLNLPNRRTSNFLGDELALWSITYHHFYVYRYTRFTLVCALSPTYVTLIIFRILYNTSATTPNVILGSLYSDIYHNP